MLSLCGLPKDIYRFDAQVPNVPSVEETFCEDCMDFLYLGATALMVVALYGLITFCDKLGARK